MPHRDLEQLVEGGLKELVARMVLEDLDQRLLVVAAVREGGALQDPVDLPPQQRNLIRPRLVRLVGVEAEEAPLADHLSACVEALHPHVIEVGGSVNGGARSSPW